MRQMSPPVQRTIRNYIAEHAPEALCSFGVSGNIFDMIFAEREARLTARLRSTSGRAADPEQLQSLIDRIRAALPDQPISPVALQEDILMWRAPSKWRFTAFPTPTSSPRCAMH